MLVRVYATMLNGDDVGFDTEEQNLNNIYATVLNTYPDVVSIVLTIEILPK